MKKSTVEVQHTVAESVRTKESKMPATFCFPNSGRRLLINEKIIFINVDNQYDNDYHYHIKNIPCSTIQCREDEL